ncbi:MAG: hypothetical protein E7658_04120 [Ruminococcaceae bacterium]|nr:hypothetical protein [Oscillospiraceae bacterium]
MSGWKRTDLPQIRPALLMVAAILALGFAWMGAAAAEAYGVLIALPFWTTAAAVCCSIIILWRSMAALLLVPVTALCLWAAGYGIFCVAAVSLTMLVVPWLAGWLMLNGKNRFVRITALSCGIALLLAAGSFAGFALYYDSFSAFHRDVLTAADILLKQAAAQGNFTFDAGMASGLTRTALLSLPAMIGAAAEFLAASVFFLSRTFLRILDCAEYFRHDTDGQITAPRSFGVLSLIALLLTLFTSPVDYPFLYCILSNILSVLALPCAYVGIREFCTGIQNRFFFFRIGPDGSVSRRIPLTFVFIGVFLVLVMGVPTVLTLSSALGAFYILRTRKTDESRS